MTLDLPAVILFLLLVAALFVVLAAQRRPDFDFANMLKDSTGKESALNMGILGSFAISSWVIMHDTLSATLTDMQFFSYLGIWSGAKVLAVAAEKWNGQLPWAKKDVA
jgi:hypothetical protein